MQINKNKDSNRKTKIIITCVVVVALLGAGAFYAYSKISQDQAAQSDPNKINDVSYNKPTQEQKDAGTEAKKQAVEHAENKDTLTPPSGTASPITITSANQEAGVLYVRTMIDTSASGGTCQLQLAKTGSTPITQEANTQLLGSYTVCQGFDIPTTNLEKGDWKITVTYKKDGASSNTEKVVTVS